MIVMWEKERKGTGFCNSHSESNVIMAPTPQTLVKCSALTSRRGRLERK